MKTGGNPNTNPKRNRCHRSVGGAYATQLSAAGKPLVRPSATSRSLWACSDATTDTLRTDVGALPIADPRYQNGQPQQVAGAVGAATPWISVSVGWNDVHLSVVGRA